MENWKRNIHKKHNAYWVCTWQRQRMKSLDWTNQRKEKNPNKIYEWTWKDRLLHSIVRLPVKKDLFIIWFVKWKAISIKTRCGVKCYVLVYVYTLPSYSLAISLLSRNGMNKAIKCMYILSIWIINVKITWYLLWPMYTTTRGSFLHFIHHIIRFWYDVVHQTFHFIHSNITKHSQFWFTQNVMDRNGINNKLKLLCWK